MTTETFEEITPRIVHGIRSMPFIKANPQWWVLEIFDGFGAHLLSLKALRMRWLAKILSLKEEGDTSHVCQAYDKFVAKSDKVVQRLSLSLLHKIFLEGTVSIIDQYGLLHCAMAAVRHTKDNPIIWENSFRACNIHPEHRMGFQEWCKAIEPHMQASDSFDLVTQNSAVDFYKLLPAFWHGMTPVEKKTVMSVVERFGDDVWQVFLCD